MSFERRPAHTWQQDIPGARWFKADLHVHTIDDHPGGKAGLPSGLSGDPADPDVLSRYATLFLRSAIAGNPNIVVNGDADMVIQLEATARRGQVANSGVIEEPAVRDAIVRTVDGGKEAFRLRGRIYGF